MLNCEKNFIILQSEKYINKTHVRYYWEKNWHDQLI